MTELHPSVLDEHLVSALRELANTRQLLVALDFDGTLAPEVDHPEDARALPEAKVAVLRLLTLPHTRIALVSGRTLESLERVSDLPDDVLLVGSHGIEFRLDTPQTRVGLDAEELERVVQVRGLLEEVAKSVDHAWVETKPAGSALHTRLASDADARRAQQLALHRATAELPGLTVRLGKNILELSVRSANKGEAINRLRDYTAADAVFYAGDDTTDEDVFAVLRVGDFGLKSGHTDTIADHRVTGPAVVAAVLNRLAELREACVRS
ncbi:MAG: trehalose-phosphatase [Lacisediminihabitans sp.]